ncbi:MAG: T9SS type A sorting domain-containing protein [Edaphocola sp.]
MKSVLFSLVFVLSVLRASAQDFTLRADTVTSTETSDLVHWVTDDSLNIYNRIFNTSSSPVIVYWQLILKDLPSDWKLYGICDNYLCRTATDPALLSFAIDSTDAIAVGDSSDLEPRLAVPSIGVGVVKIRTFTDSDADTAVYLIYKGTAGIAAITVADKRVNLYPNPTGNDLIVYTDKNLGAARLDVVSLTGARVTSALVAKEVTTINTSEMAKGIYTVKVVDEKGNLITTRKFTKD